MVYRLLDVDTEWPLLAYEFESRGTTLPNPHFAMIVGAFDDRTEPHTLAGFLVVQLQFHFEPLVLYEPRALRGLVREAEAALKARVGTQDARYFSFADTEHVVEICEIMGMRPVHSRLFFKDLTA